MKKQSAARETGERAVRVVTKVVISYRLEDDPKAPERTMTLAHGGGGEVIDGLIWSDALIRKLAYLENGSCVEAKKEEGTGEWKLLMSDRGEGGECVWIHDDTCMWFEYCPPI